ncbi:SPASM domain-containing protein [Bergeyella zoohelcum]|uniref:SPASM domain-containing protein n=1 Tax=Bergeyella zoohelcum TaxID=1015 RepID=UPI0009D96A53
MNYDGNIFKCTARDFTSENSEGVIDDEGELIWNDKFYVRRNIKFSNAPCLECKILPICNGSCSQHYIENIGKGFCIYDFDESKKINQVKQIFLEEINKL